MNPANLGLVISLSTMLIAIVSVWKDVYVKSKSKAFHLRFSRIGIVLIISSFLFIVVNYIKDTQTERELKTAELARNKSDSLFNDSQKKLFKSQELLYSASVRVNSLKIDWEFDGLRDSNLAYESFSYTELNARSNGLEYQNNQNGYFSFFTTLINSLPTSESYPDTIKDMVSLVALDDTYSTIISYGRITRNVQGLSSSIVQLGGTDDFQGEIPKVHSLGKHKYSITWRIDPSTLGKVINYSSANMQLTYLLPNSVNVLFILSTYATSPFNLKNLTQFNYLGYFPEDWMTPDTGTKFDIKNYPFASARIRLSPNFDTSRSAVYELVSCAREEFNLPLEPQIPVCDYAIFHYRRVNKGN